MGFAVQTTLRTMDDPRSRYIAFAAVVVVHLALLHIAQRVSGAAHRAQRVADDAMVWLRLDRPVEVPPNVARVEPSRRERPRVERESSLPLPEAPAETPETTTLPPRQVDWRANAARSAQLVAEGAQQAPHRSFNPRQEPEREGPAPPSMFHEGSKPKYGDVGEVDGKPVVWMSENCYTELDRSVRDARDAVINPGSFAAPAINCVGGEVGKFRLVQPNPSSFTPWSLNYSRALGNRAADGTLFEHIKKPEEPPVPKAGTEMNELPERAEELQR